MSDNDDFNFDDDLFGDDDDLFGDDSDFDSGDDFGGDDFSDSFDDFDDDAGDFDSGIDMAEEDITFIDEDEGRDEGGGTSRAFIILAGLMILVFLIGLGLLLFLLLGPQDATPTQLTATRIVELNMTTEKQIQETQTQSVLDGTSTAVAGTAIAEDMTNTAIANFADQTATQEAFREQETATAIAFNEQLTQTAEAISASQTADVVQQTSAALTATALVSTPDAPVDTPVAVTPTDDGGTDPLLAAQMTATALADIFNQTPGGPPTVPVGGQQTQVPVTTGGTTGELPDTGVFDDLASGNAGVFFLMAFGLIGAIVVSRGVRRKRK